MAINRVNSYFKHPIIIDDLRHHKETEIIGVVKESPDLTRAFRTYDIDKKIHKFYSSDPDSNEKFDFIHSSSFRLVLETILNDKKTPENLTLSIYIEPINAENKPLKLTIGDLRNGQIILRHSIHPKLDIQDLEHWLPEFKNLFRSLELEEYQIDALKRCVPQAWKLLSSQLMN